jgi:hypothetical protein
MANIRKLVDYLLNREPEKFTDGQWIALGLYLVSTSLDELPGALGELRPDSTVVDAIREVRDMIDSTAGAGNAEIDALTSIGEALIGISSSIDELKGDE